MASHKSSLDHHHPLSCNPGFRFDQFYLLLTVFFCSGVSSRTRSRSRQADTSTDMSLPDPRPVVAPRRRRQTARQPGPAPPPPQPDQVPCNGNLLLAHYNPNHLRSSPCNQTKFQIICLQAIHQIIRDICIDKKYLTCSICLQNQNHIRARMAKQHNLLVQLTDDILSRKVSNSNI